MSPSLSDLLEIAPSFILFIPGFIPPLFVVQSCLIGPSVRPKRAPIICIFVSLLGPLATVSAALSIAGLVVVQYRHSLSIAHIITQSFLEFAYRIPVLYVIMPRSFITVASQVSLSRKQINRHGALFATIIITTFILTVIHTSLIPTPFPNLLVLVLNLLATVYPIPFLLMMVVLTQSKRVRRVWIFISVLQLLSTVAGALRVPEGSIYAICSAFFTALWGSGVITLFCTFYSAPLSRTADSPHLRLSAFSPPYVAPSTPKRVHYTSPNVRTSSTGAVISEDFTALHDPFASPTSLFPSPKKVQSLSTSLIASPSPALSTSMCRDYSVGSRTAAKKSRPLCRPPPRSSSCVALNNKTSLQSLQLLQNEAAESPHGFSDQNSGARDSNEDSFFLNDEALLSQVLLHALTMKVRPTISTHEADSDYEQSVMLHRTSSAALCQEGLREQRRDSKSVHSKHISDKDFRKSGVQTLSIHPPHSSLKTVNLKTEQELEESLMNRFSNSGMDQLISKDKKVVITSHMTGGAAQGESSLITPVGTSDKAWWSKS